MPRIAIVAVVVVVLGIGGCLVAGWLQSDEDRIAAQLEAICEAFNDMSAKGVVDGLADDFEDEKTKADRSFVRLGLNQYFSRVRMDKSQPSYRAAIDRATVVVTFQDAENATATFRATMTRVGSDSQAFAGEFSVKVRKVEGEWLLTSSDYETLDGRMPLQP